MNISFVEKPPENSVNDGHKNEPVKSDAVTVERLVGFASSSATRKRGPPEV